MMMYRELLRQGEETMIGIKKVFVCGLGR